jgi:cysteine synthase A
MARLSRIVPAGSGDVFVKMEQLCLGGSVKTRTALGMIEAAERDGKLGPDSVIVEPTSGNQGIAIAQVAAVKGYRVRIVMPSSMSLERRKLIGAYGAELVLTEPAEDVQSTFARCIEVAYEIAESDPDVVVLQQFENPANPEIHFTTTGPEIWEQMDGAVDAFVAGVGTGGTITGVGRFLAGQGSSAGVYAVEPEAAPAISGGEISSHRQQGIGDGFIPHNCDLDVVDHVVRVSDTDALATAKRLAAEEGLAVGISAGSNVWAAIRVASELGEGSRVVTLLPDTAERYFSTELFEQ